MRRAALLLAAALAAACAKPQPAGPKTVTVPSGEWSFEVPSDWSSVDDADLKRRPVARVTLLGKLAEEDQGVLIGAAISLTKFYRKQADHPQGAKGFASYRERILDQRDAIFGGKAAPGTSGLKEETVSGLPARSFRVDSASFPRVHRKTAAPMKAEELLIQAPGAYYELEYHAPPELFDRYRPAFEKAKASLRLNPAAG